MMCNIIIENEELTEEYWKYLFDMAKVELEEEKYRNRCIQESYKQKQFLFIDSIWCAGLTLRPNAIG